MNLGHVDVACKTSYRLESSTSSRCSSTLLVLSVLALDSTACGDVWRRPPCLARRAHPGGAPFGGGTLPLRLIFRGGGFDGGGGPRLEGLSMYLCVTLAPLLQLGFARAPRQTVSTGTTAACSVTRSFERLSGGFGTAKRLFFSKLSGGPDQTQPVLQPQGKGLLNKKLGSRNLECEWEYRAPSRDGYTGSRRESWQRR